MKSITLKLSSKISTFIGVSTGSNNTTPSATTTNGNQQSAQQSAHVTSSTVTTRETSLTTLPPTVKVTAGTSTSSSNTTFSMERTNEQRGTSVSSTSTQQSNNSTTQYHNQQHHHHNIQPQHNLSVTTLSSLGERINPSSTGGVSSTAMSSSVGSGQGSGPASLDSLSSTMGGIANSSGGTERTRDLALCAVLLDEWLKELAAIAQEQSVVMINIGY